MQVCTLLQTDNHASTPPLSSLQARCPSCHPTNSVKALKYNTQAKQIHWDLICKTAAVNSKQWERLPCRCTAWGTSRHWRCPGSTYEQVISTCQSHDITVSTCGTTTSWQIQCQQQTPCLSVTESLAKDDHTTNTSHHGFAHQQWTLSSTKYKLRTILRIKKAKVAHTRLLSVGFRSWSQFLAVSLQVTWVTNPAAGCHYFLPGPQLPLRGLLPISLFDEQRHDGCEQFA